MMTESVAGTGEAQSTDENLATPWLIALKDKAARGERLRGKAHVRWLGDFLVKATSYDLLPTERQLLDACVRGVRSPSAGRVVCATKGADGGHGGSSA